ncbi:tyrosine-type recombinase/integrase [Dactylosporangium sp. CA-139114]|uniref:tyrosine-type recombinase/integrase n=1 Tax=Dactylosporangium sp. CA-139114 TaxID=3239931 RepID=UPI003D97E775
MATDVLRVHLASGFVGEEPDALLFTGGKGALLRSGNFGRAVQWVVTVVSVGLPAGFHFHDLRHTGNTIAAASGASTRELMKRLGQSSMRAALIYQHSTDERDREIASNMDERIKKIWHATGTAADTRSRKQKPQVG